MKILKIEEERHIENYLVKRNLLAQYKRAKSFLLMGNIFQVQFRFRKPKSDKIFYFRINKQFRAHCYFENSTVIVFKIDNHQN